MRICPCRSVSMRSGIFARRGSAMICAQRSRLNLVCDLRSGSSIVIGTPGRYARNVKKAIARPRPFSYFLRRRKL